MCLTLQLSRHSNVSRSSIPNRIMKARILVVRRHLATLLSRKAVCSRVMSVSIFSHALTCSLKSSISCELGVPLVRARARDISCVDRIVSCVALF